MKLRTLFLLAMIAQEAFAQSGTIVGRVVDSATSQAVVGATVQVSGTTYAAITNETGAFRIAGIPAGILVLRVRRTSFAEATREVRLVAAGTIELEIRLEALASSLGEVNVTAPSEIRETRQSPFSVTVLDAQKLVGRGITLDEALQRVTGMQVRRSGGLGSTSLFHIRGLEGNRIQVYIDGNAANIAGNVFSLDNIPLALVDRVEIYKGVVPAQFGGDGLGAAVNVVIRKFPNGYDDGSYTFGSFGQHQLSTLLIRRPSRNLEVGVSANFDMAANNYRMESPFVPGLRIDRDHDRFQRLLVGGVLKYEGGWFDKVHLETALITSAREIQGIQTNLQHAETSSELGVLVLDGEREGALGGRLDVRLGLVGLTSTARLLDTSSMRYQFRGAAYPSPNGRGELGALPSNSDNRTRFLRHRGAFTFRLAAQHTANLTYTLDHSRFLPRDTLANRYAGSNVSEFPGRQTNLIVGLSHEWRPVAERFVSVLGTRAYAFSSEGTPLNRWDPTAERPPAVRNNTFSLGASNAIRYFVTPRLLVKGSIEVARRLPESSELFGDGMLLQPAPTLKPERSTNLNVGFQYERGRPGDAHMQAEINGFWMQMRDMIQLAQSGVAGAAHTNIGKARIAGIDAELKGNLTPWLYASVGITYQDARDALEQLPGSFVRSPTYQLRLPNLPWLFGNTAIEAQFVDLVGGRQQTRFYLETNFTDEYFYAFEMSRSQERRIPRALTHTFGFEQQWLRSGVTLSAEVQNLSGAQVINQFRQPLPGRTLRAKLRYTRIRG